MRERRANPIGRAATASVQRVAVGGLRVAVLDLEQTANFLIEMVFPRRRADRPLYLTSANGEVLARCSTEPMTDRLFRAADLINADGQPLVTISRLNAARPLPERVATTDLFHVVARKAEAAGLTFYMFGADEAENEAAVANVRKMYPNLKIVGRSHGYLRGEALRAKVDEINALAPDYLWVALGVPYEQAFVEQYTPPACSTSCPAAAPARRNGCRMSGSNGPGGSGSSRAGCSGATSPPIRARSICCSTRAIHRSATAPSGTDRRKGGCGPPPGTTRAPRLPALQRLDLHLAEFDHARAILKRDRAAGVL